VQIVDEYTGRVMADRSWERGLHQMIEAKEGCAITGQQETLARISYQRFFRRYLRVAGMTGTAREVARELWAVYRLPVVTIPTNRPVGAGACRRGLRHRRGEVDRRSSIRCAACRRKAVPSRRHPLGSASEHLSELAYARGTAAPSIERPPGPGRGRGDRRAGERGRITVATNMAGRGTDIRPCPGVAELGGLHVLADLSATMPAGSTASCSGAAGGRAIPAVSQCA
jgi:preprotein translocase subunit SecA